MLPEQCYIWWTNQNDAEDVDLMKDMVWPDYLKIEHKSRLGRNGRGRLWVSNSWGDISSLRVVWDDTQLIFRITGRHYGGIVFDRNDVEYLKILPGFITDMNMNVIHGEPIDQPYIDKGYWD